MNFFRVERNLAALLILGAATGLILANSGGYLLVDTLKSVELGLPGIGFTLEGWIHNFGIPAFFALVGLELRREFHDGLFADRKALLVPGLAAIFGVALPAIAYLSVVGWNSPLALGWPIPTATDITFSLAILLVFGKRLPAAARTFLLAFAIIDDVIGILIITFLYAGSMQVAPLALALAGLAIFYGLGLTLAKTRNSGLHRACGALMWITALTALYQTVESGLQPTITGVALGMLVPIAQNPNLERQLHPWIAGLILPIFALFVTAIPFASGNVFNQLVFWAVLTRPFAKVLGITLGAYLGYKIAKPIPNLDMSTVFRLSFLGGIGFTVSLLIAQITFSMEPLIEAAAIAATLAASGLSAVLGAIALLTAHSSEPGNGS